LGYRLGGDVSHNQFLINNLITMNRSNLKNLFEEIYFSKDEEELTKVIESHPEIFDDSNWKPLGEDEVNY
jgi:hypothetical protein